MNVSFLGADPFTANLGVSALFATMVSGIARRIHEVDISVFDTLLGAREATLRLDDGGPIPLKFIGIRHGRRIHRWENLRNLKFCARLGPAGRWVNPGLSMLSKSAAVLDVSGGDSFTDMYPDDRMRLIAGAKELVLDLGRPLILLPQTYGPFGKSRARAVEILRRSRAAWARDLRSFSLLRDLLGCDFDPDRHRCGVDMAFGLPVMEPCAEARDSVLASMGVGPRPLGVNVSGLLYNNPVKAKEKYGFKADYSRLLERFLGWVLESTDHPVWLIPHVMAPISSEESDPKACLDLARKFQSHAGRVRVSDISLNQSEAKWLISQMEWFCGTRMHATIAGLSTCTPTATVSYSDKALGVFESCGQGEEVLDPRKLDTDSVVAGMIGSYQRRAAIRCSLENQIPRVKHLAEQQMDDIAGLVRDCAEEGRRAGRRFQG